jgi:predicted RND superfamily exporter protein
MGDDSATPKPGSKSNAKMIKKDVNETQSYTQYDSIFKLESERLLIERERLDVEKQKVMVLEQININLTELVAQQRRSLTNVGDTIPVDTQQSDGNTYVNMDTGAWVSESNIQ